MPRNNQRSQFAPDFFLMDALDEAHAVHHEATLRLHACAVAIVDYTERMLSLSGKLRNTKPTIDGEAEKDRMTLPEAIRPNPPQEEAA